MKMIEITSAPLSKFVQHVYAASSPAGMGHLHYKEGALPESYVEKLLDDAWSDYRARKEADIERVYKNKIGLIEGIFERPATDKEKQEKYEETKTKVISEYDNQMTCLFSLDYVQGRACKMTVFANGWDPVRLFINPSWLDHTDAQFQALRDKFEVKS